MSEWRAVAAEREWESALSIRVVSSLRNRHERKRMGLELAIGSGHTAQYSAWVESGRMLTACGWTAVVSQFFHTFQKKIVMAKKKDVSGKI